MNTLDNTAENVLQWAKDRDILEHSNTMTQAIKTLEEVQELLNAIDLKDEEEVIDAYGDIFVTLVIGSHINGGSLAEYAENAYNVIKNRKGRLLPNGSFLKEQILKDM